MSKSVLIFFACALASLQGLFAQLPSSQMGSSTIPGSKMEPLKPLEKSRPGTPPSKEVLPEPIKPPQMIPQRASYLHPGILVNVKNQWEGSDHLLNLANQIGVYVKILKPEKAELDASENDLQKIVEEIFTNSNIQPTTMAVAGKPPLPAFDIEIFVYPIEGGYATFLDGRLFESVMLERFKMDSNMAFQAITWEKQNLIVTPKDQFKEQLIKAVKEIAETFVTRFQAYENLRKSTTN